MTIEKAHLDVLDAAILADHAMGGVFLVCASHQPSLSVVGQRGLPDAFIRKLEQVSLGDGTAAAQAMAERRRICIRDVQLDPRFEPYRDLAASAGFRAVQATPLISEAGSFLGVLSTYYAEPHHPSTAAGADLDLCARIGALLIELERIHESRDITVSSHQRGVIFEQVAVVKRELLPQFRRGDMHIGRSIVQRLGDAIRDLRKSNRTSGPTKPLPR